MVKIALLIGLAVVLGTVTLLNPAFLASNKFVADFVGPEMISLLLVILTVTLASIANIFVSINRIVEIKHQGDGVARKTGDRLKRELSDNCWYMFWAFLVAVILMVLGGIPDLPESIASAILATMLWTLGLYLACLYDVFIVAFGIADLHSE